MSKYTINQGPHLLTSVGINMPLSGFCYVGIVNSLDEGVDTAILDALYFSYRPVRISIIRATRLQVAPLLAEE